MGHYFDINNVDIINCSEDNFLLDTNALLWAFYPNSQATNSSAANYSNFISDLISNDKTLYIPTFNLSEAIHVIEKIEYEIYKANNQQRSLKFKQYRAILHERNNLKGTLQLFLDQINNISQIKILDQNLTLTTVTSFLKDMNNHQLDVFDMYLLEFSDNNNYSIITDDKDFCSVDCKSDIYTCNQIILSST